MVRKSVTCLIALIVSATALVAADKEITGKISKVDHEKKIVTITTHDGKKDFVIGADTKFFDPQGKVTRDGLKDKHLVAGAEVTVVTASGAKTIKELHLEPVRGIKDAKDSHDAKDKRETKKDVGEAKKDVKGIKGKVAKVDIERKTVWVTTDEGKKMEFSIGDNTEFIGPRGGISKERIKDDRFVTGAEITIVTSANGKAVEEIHLPYRKRVEENGKTDKKDK